MPSGGYHMGEGTMQHAEQIKALLATLGTTGSQVARSLAQMNCGGERNSCRTNPLVVLLTRRGYGESRVGVNETDGAIWIGQGGVNGSERQWCPLSTHPRLRGAYEFLLYFDRGYYDEVADHAHP